MSETNAPQPPADQNQQPAAGGQQPTTPPPSQQYGQQPPQYAQQPPQYGQQPYGQQQQYGQQPQYGAPAPAQPLSPESDKTAAMWAHIGGVIGFLPSLIIWLVLKDRGPRTNVEGKEALNWQITFTIIYVALWIAFDIIGLVFWPLLFLGWLLPLAWWILNVVFSIMGGMRVNAGGSYRYPFNFRFIK
jgi:uncharacterized Tic20 family protein